MKTVVMLLFVSLLSTNFETKTSKKEEKEAIKKTVTTYLKGGDERNSTLLNEAMHEDFRVVLHRAFGGEKTSVLSKETYVKMVEDEKLGGTKRTVKFKSVDYSGNVATVKANLESDKLIFESYYDLVKNTDGKWQIVSDMPHVTKK